MDYLCTLDLVYLPSEEEIPTVTNFTVEQKNPSLIPMAFSQKRLTSEEAVSTQQTPIFKTFYVKRQRQTLSAVFLRVAGLPHSLSGNAC